MYFDGILGTLTYYKDGVNLGVAFTGLNEVKEPVYPIICSTAAKTEMSLGVLKRDFLNLQDRWVISLFRRSKNILVRLIMFLRALQGLEKLIFFMKNGIKVLK